jgi:hypothetical protein
MCVLICSVQLLFPFTFRADKYLAIIVDVLAELHADLQLVSVITPSLYTKLEHNDKV